MKDKIVEEIRKIRCDIEAEYGNNPNLHLEHIYRAQAKHGDKLLCRKPKRFKQKAIGGR